MALLQRFDPPAFMNDFDGLPGMRQAWSEFVSAAFDASIHSEIKAVTTGGGKAIGTIQYFNPTKYDPGGPLIEQAITWNAFPKELLVQLGRKRALIEADRLWPLAAYGGRLFQYDPDLPDATNHASGMPNDVYYRPQVEYCEWHVERDRQSGAITKIIFTSEPPEYWMAMFGQSMDAGGNVGGDFKFPGSPELVLDLYRKLVSPEIKPEDLLVKKAFDGPAGHYKVGDYNPYNPWNTVLGIMHLCAPPNTLPAEIQLGADATVLYGVNGTEPIVQPDALICAAGYGGPNRNSDPTIGGSVNALARLGAMVTLINPVGLYMDHIDTSGWELPKGIAARDCISIVRGSPGRIERLVVAAPPDSGVTMSDLKIAGVPVQYGGQIAECITVKLVGGAAALGSVKGNDLNPPANRGLLAMPEPSEIYALVDPAQHIPPGFAQAFEHEAGAYQGARPPHAANVMSDAGQRRSMNRRIP
jgi:hypothetical protein